jgi:aspartyl-tRNA(Asn)/glutamyl-tRNA(Gln) amidotransferase subunit C
MKINVPHIAKLANIAISDEEAKIFEPQLSAVLDYIKRLDQVNTEQIEPTSQVTGLENVLRRDEVRTSLPQEKAIKPANASHNGQFQVKGILDQS